MKRLVAALAVPVALAFCMSAVWAGAPAPDALLSDTDRRHQEQALQNALEFNRTGQAESWENGETGHWGTVTPTLTYRNAAGQDCRKFEREVIIDGRQARVWSTRCRTAAGVWLQPVAPKPVYTRVYEDHHRHYPHPRRYPYYRAASIILFYGIGYERPRRYHRHDRLHRRARPHRHDRLHRHGRLQRRERPHRLSRQDQADRHHRHDRADRRGRR